MNPIASKRPWLDDIRIGLAYYFFTSLIVVLGVAFGREFVKPPAQRSEAIPKDFLASFSPWDGLHYKSIVENGYFYDPERQSNVAFFPAYPVLARTLKDFTGLQTVPALLVVSHAFLAGAFVLLRTYMRFRFPDAGPSVWDSTVFAFGVFPTTFFFRMTYTESMFVFLAILALLAMERGWPLIWVAVVCGLATVTRPVGVALIPPFLLHVWQRAESGRSFVWDSSLLLPLSLWGLLGYMAYQDAAFGDPLAFAKTQEQWHAGPLEVLPNKTLSLLTFDPIVGVFDPESSRYWARHEWHGNPVFSLILANPIYFCLMAAIVIVAVIRQKLTALEVVLSVGLILIPYVTRAHEMSMGAFGRFAATVFPAYAMMALAEASWRLAFSSALRVVFPTYLFLYSALYSVGHLLY
jgi:mannosyltransferase PIG-V